MSKLSFNIFITVISLLSQYFSGSLLVAIVSRLENWKIIIQPHFHDTFTSLLEKESHMFSSSLSLKRSWIKLLLEHYFQKTHLNFDLPTSLEHFSHRKIRIKTFIKYYDMKVWRIIKLGDLSIVAANKGIKKLDGAQASTKKIPTLNDYTNK